MLTLTAFNTINNFNPRSPRGGATKPRNSFASTLRFQSTLPTRGSDGIHRYGNPTQVISIHAPHEGERPFFYLLALRHYISIHAPHEGERRSRFCQAFYLTKLISIHAPHEGERPAPPVDINDLAANFNPRSPRGGATREHLQRPRGPHISIHAPHEGERREHPTSLTVNLSHVNPRSPRGGATAEHYAQSDNAAISIHAPHEGERRIKSAV